MFCYRTGHGRCISCGLGQWGTESNDLNLNVEWIIDDREADRADIATVDEIRQSK